MSKFLPFNLAYEVEQVEYRCIKLETLNAELLEALERCFDLMDNGGTWSLEDQAAARAAIAKAKGEQP